MPSHRHDWLIWTITTQLKTQTNARREHKTWYSPWWKIPGVYVGGGGLHSIFMRDNGCVYILVKECSRLILYSSISFGDAKPGYKGLSLLTLGELVLGWSNMEFLWGWSSGSASVKASVGTQKTTVVLSGDQRQTEGLVPSSLLVFWSCERGQRT